MMPFDEFVMQQYTTKEEADGYLHDAHACDAGCVVCAEIAFLGTYNQ